MIIGIQEYLIPEELTIMSKTDLHGTITDGTDYFEMVNGFSRNELIGSPHNLVRDPDFPSAVFKELWRTLIAGLQWRQVIKSNSSKPVTITGENHAH